MRGEAEAWRTGLVILVLVAVGYRLAGVVVARWGVVPLAATVLLLMVASLGSRGWR